MSQGEPNGNGEEGVGSADAPVAANAVGSDAAEEETSWWASEEVFEFWATILIALAAIAVAWAGFESSKWSGVQATDFSQAGAARTESVRFSTLAGQQTTIDIITFTNWLNSAVADIDSGEIEAPASAAVYEPTAGTLSGFYFQRFRDEFTPAVRAWLDTNPFNNPDAPPSPFAMDEYQLAATTQSQELENRADQKASDAATANQRSDNYVLSAVLFAAALFFAALASRLKSPPYRYGALIVATLVFLGTLMYVLSQPIEI